MRKIAQAVNVIWKHPALRDMAMLGHHAVTIPAWEQPADNFGRVWSPAPLPEAAFCVLKPTWHSEGGRNLTTWSEHGIDHRANRLNDEQVHWSVLT
jgi:hypothetical protein